MPVGFTLNSILVNGLLCLVVLKSIISSLCLLGHSTNLVVFRVHVYTVRINGYHCHHFLTLFLYLFVAVQNEQHDLTVSVSRDSRSSQILRRDPDDDLVGQLISQVEQLKLEKEASGEQQRRMRDERDVATRRATELEQEVRSLREEIASSLEEKNNEIDSLQQRVDTERQSKETLMREKERVQSELSEKDREVRHLSKQKNDLEVLLSAEASVNASLNLEGEIMRISSRKVTLTDQI